MDLLEQARAAGLALGLGEAGVEVGLERVQDAVGAPSRAEARSSSRSVSRKRRTVLRSRFRRRAMALIVQPFSARWWMSSKRWRVRSMIWVRGSSDTGSSIATGSGTITELRSEP